MTPHINAKPGAFADICLMPGDPLRAKYIAENLMEGAELVTDVRNMFGYTGEYKGCKVSVMGAGMGIPSASIYYKELITDYGVDKIIRIGSCGAVSEEVKLGDIIIGMGACTDSKVNRIRFKDHDFAAIADYELLENAVNTARKKKIPFRVGNLFTTDLFYSPEEDLFDVLERHGVMGVEMEAAGLYGKCAEYGAKGLAICTVSDHLRRGEHMTPEERQLSFKEMMDLAFGTVLELGSK